MLLITGLGNVGNKYAKNRHNVGFVALDKIADLYNFSPYCNKFSGFFSVGNICGNKVALIKPSTLINNSGVSVGAVARFFKINSNNIFVIHDDIDLVLGKVRVKLGGGSGGHNGIKSIDMAICKDYWRIRIGIDRPDYKDMVSSYVLSDFSEEKIFIIEEVLSSIANNLPLLLEGPHDLFMSKFDNK